MNKIKSFIDWVGQILRFNRYQRTSRFITNSLNIDRLAVQHGVTSERVGRFLEAELAWVYQVQIVLNPFDFNLEISEIDRLHDYSALCLFLDKTGKKRFVTSNPDLIMSRTQEYEALQRAGVEFQLASMDVLEATLSRIKMVKNVLDVISEEQKFTFSLFLLSFLDCLDLGVTEVEYVEGRYVATSKDVKYEGVV